MTTPVERLLAALPDAKRSGKGWVARCPAHDDRQASLSISQGDNGGALLHCHANCEPAAVVAAIALTLADLMPATRYPMNAKIPHESSKPRIIAQYDYRDEAGKVLFQVVRLEPKGFRQRKPKSGGGWEPSVKGVRTVPYRLAEFLAADKSRSVAVVEGEKDADNLARIGVLATCNAGGAGKWTAEHAAFLQGRRVYIMPDNDDAGRNHAQQVAQSLQGIASSVQVIKLPGLLPKGDVSDWIAAGGTKEKLSQLAEAAPVWTPTANEPKYVPFPVDALPEPACGFVASAAAALRCDPAYVALPLLAAFASAIGNARRVELKRSWSEPCVLWTVIIGESGTLKSPAIDLALAHVRARQAVAHREHLEATKIYERDLLLYEADLAQWKRDGRKKGEPAPVKPEPPPWKQYVAEDTTIEALAVLLADQPHGLLVSRDELAGWLNSFDAYKSARGADVAHWLSMHRAGNLLVNRKSGRTVIHVPRASVSICGGIQPRTLAAALAGRYSADGPDAMEKPAAEHFANGLAARLLLAMPPRVAKQWTEDDLADAERERIARRFDDLFSLEVGTDEHGELAPVHLLLTPDAKARFVRFYNDHAAEQCTLDSDLAAAWSKLEGYAPRLALVFQLIRDPTSTSIDDDSMAAAIELVRWFADEAARVYGTLGAGEESPEVREARDDNRLAAWIRDQGGAVTVRDVTRGPRQYRGDSDAAESALRRLKDSGQGRWEEVHTGKRGGRPTRVFWLSGVGDGDVTSERPQTIRVLSPSPMVMGEKTGGRVKVTI